MCAPQTRVIRGSDYKDRKEGRREENKGKDEDWGNSGGTTSDRTRSNDLAGRFTSLANDLAGGSPCQLLCFGNSVNFLNSKRPGSFTVLGVCT